MRAASDFFLMLVTAPNLKTARALGRGVVEARLAACANLNPGIESHYRWRGRVESAREVMILFKTVRSKVRLLEDYILKHHPYDTPEVITVRLAHGTTRYLAWLEESVRAAKPKAPGGKRRARSGVAQAA